MADNWGAQAASSATDTWGASVDNSNFDNGDSSAAVAATPTPAPVVQNVPEPVKGWTKPSAYDYTDEAPTWDGNAAVYEFDGDTGDLGPEHPDLERQLFGDPNGTTNSHGIDFSA